ncbi:hypothetical protein [Actinopolymorpha alba]|nr:hypothetical protein [Actinopolymorpha alba]
MAGDSAVDSGEQPELGPLINFAGAAAVIVKDFRRYMTKTFHDP